MIQLSKFPFKTLKNIPTDIKIKSHQLLFQAWFIRESAAWRYYYLPFWLKVRDKITQVIEKEMNKTWALKILAPVLHPLELWKETNRTESVGFELMIVKDRNKAEFALWWTAEEMMIDLVRKFTISYKDLPFNIYQFSQKFRDEMRARWWLLRLREFLMKDAYSFHTDEEDFKIEYKKMWDTYINIFKILWLDALPVDADNWYIGGDYCHEFVVVSDTWESRFLSTKDGKYNTHEDIAKFNKQTYNVNEDLKELKEINATRGKTMEDWVNFHNLPLWQQIKDVLFVNEKWKFILAIIRWDLDVNETKLAKISQSNDLRLVTDEEVKLLWTEPWFISPVNINKDVIIVADDSLRTIKNAYGWANKKNTDLLNINIDRDYKPHIEWDIAMAKDWHLTLDNEIFYESKWIEVWNIFQLGYHYSKKMNFNFVDKDWKNKLIYMGCYGIWIDRTMAAIVEKYNDENGIIWPENIAPFSHYIIVHWDYLKEALKLAETFEKEWKEVIIDDREIWFGQKAWDADLIWIPYRIIVSEKSMKENSYELKWRKEKEWILIKF